MCSGTKNPKDPRKIGKKHSHEFFFFLKILFFTHTQNSFSGGEKVENIGALAGFSFNISLRPLFFFLVDNNVTKTKTNRKTGKKEFWGQLDLPSQIRKKLGVIAYQKIFRDGSTATVTGPVKIKFSQEKKLLSISYGYFLQNQDGRPAKGMAENWKLPVVAPVVVVKEEALDK